MMFTISSSKELNMKEKSFDFLKKISRKIKWIYCNQFINSCNKIFQQVHTENFSMLVLLNEVVGREIYTLGYYEKNYSDYLSREILNNDICIDVGGNVGYYSLLMSFAAANGEVHTFEPIGLNADIIRLNASLNSLTNIQVNNLALGKKSGILNFSLTQDSAYSSTIDSLNSISRDENINLISVEQIKLDDYIAANQIHKVDIIKIDVEGGETNVLHGAEKLLASKSGPRLIMIELFDEFLIKNGSSSKEIIVYLENFGYYPYYPDADLNLISFKNEDINKIFNVFFLKKSNSLR